LNELLNQYPQEIKEILGSYPAEYKRSAIMPLLFLAQTGPGYITPQAIRDISEITGVTSTEVDSIVGFYTLFHEQPGGRWRIQVCTDLPCALRGSEQFIQQICDTLGVKVGETSADGLFSVEAVTCLAACHRAPVFQLQGDGEIAYHENQSLETVKELVAALRAKAGKEGK
jgi:NADH-quinone oxidoreductase subunit E